MTVLNTALLRRVETALCRDPIVAENIKWHRASITLICDSEQWTFTVREGNVLLEDVEHSAEQPEILIQGRSEDWQPLLSGMQGGLHRAFRHKLLFFEGDAVAMLTLWKTLWRIGDALGAVSKGE